MLEEIGHRETGTQEQWGQTINWFTNTSFGSIFTIFNKDAGKHNNMNWTMPFLEAFIPVYKKISTLEII